MSVPVKILKYISPHINTLTQTKVRGVGEGRSGEDKRWRDSDMDWVLGKIKEENNYIEFASHEACFH